MDTCDSVTSTPGKMSTTEIHIITKMQLNYCTVHSLKKESALSMMQTIFPAANVNAGHCITLGIGLK